MIAQLIILSTIAIGIFLFLFFSARKKLRKQGHQMSGEPYRAALENLANYFPGYLSKFYRFFERGALVFIGQYAGCEFRASFSPATHLMLVPPTRLFLTCRCPTENNLKIFIYKENPRAVFLAKRIDIADHDLSTFFIYANRPDEAMRFFNDKDKRTLFKQFIKDGWEPPQITGSKISTARAIKDHQLDPSFIKDTLDKMMALSALRGGLVRIDNIAPRHTSELYSKLPLFPEASRFALFILGTAITIKLCAVLLTSSLATSDLFTVQGKIADINIGGDGRPSYIELESSGNVDRYSFFYGRGWPGMSSLKKGQTINITAWEQGRVGRFRSSRPSLYIWQLTRGDDVIIRGEDIATLRAESNNTINRSGTWVLIIGTILAVTVYLGRFITRSKNAQERKGTENN